jgi:DNA invertase Pin-like site-specific DNA recombinase
MKQRMQLAIYARVSTDAHGQDPLNQLLQLREFAQQQGWAIVREYTDEMTAKNGNRPGFNANVEGRRSAPFRLPAVLESGQAHA